MAKKKANPDPSPAVDMLTWLAETTEAVELKGAKLPYISVTGNMYGFITAEGQLALRLSEEDRSAFLAKHEDAVCQQHGRVMKEYIVVPAAILQNKRRLRPLFNKSHGYAMTLKPKPTTRKKK